MPTAKKAAKYTTSMLTANGLTRENWRRSQITRWVSWDITPKPDLPYEVIDSKVSPLIGTWPNSSSSVSYSEANGCNGLVAKSCLAMSVAITNSRYVDKVRRGESAGLGATIAEGRDALKMIHTRATRMRKGYEHLRRGRFRRFLSLMNVRPRNRHRKTIWTRPKDAAALWLEYWMGWAPLVGDIYSACQVLSQEYPKARFRAWSSAKGVRFLNDGQMDVLVRTAMTADAEITNPNLFLASQMGLINPFQIAWELVPFSFVINWFIPVDNLLASLSEFLGIKMTNQTSAIKCDVKGRHVVKYLTTTVSAYDHRTVWFKRSLGPLPDIPNIPEFGLPVWNKARAATAISLLVSMFTKG